MALGLVPAAAASQFIERDARGVRISVDVHGDALVSYLGSGGSRTGSLVKKYVFLSGTQIGALPPTAGAHQAHWASSGIYLNPYKAQALINGFKDTCKPYDGQALPFLVAACKAGDGSYWALQNWQTPLPDLGFSPWRPEQAQFWLHVSHWRGAPAKLEVWQDWVYDGRYREVFGRYSYASKPVYGFGTTAVGAPTDLFGRLIYLDTVGSVYGAGWRRENSFVPHNPTGVFCYGFYPFDSSKGGYEQPPGYTGGLRGPGVGTQYRLIAEGPGLTPDVLWQGQALHAFHAGSVDDLTFQASMNAQLAALGTDKLCAAGHALQTQLGGSQPRTTTNASPAAPSGGSGGKCPIDVTFVSAAYQVILGREVTAQEQTYWRGALNGAKGASLRFRMTDQLAAGDEARQAMLQALFRHLLGRDATTAEITRMLALPTSDEAIAAVVTSPEYVSRAGSTVDTWIDKITSELLGGALGSTAKAPLVALATSQGKLAAAVSLLQSQQYRAQVVRAQFHRVLSRSPNAGELASYAPATSPANADRVDQQAHLTADLTSSGEYLNKALSACNTGN